MLSAYFPDQEPYFTHDCPKCKYMFSIQEENEQGDKRRADIYKACDGSVCDYLIRYSDEPSDYSTSSLEFVFWGYCRNMNNWHKVGEEPK